MSPPEAPDRGSKTFIKCPVEGCDTVMSAREMDQHILQSVGDGHGEQGEVPENYSLDDLEEVAAPDRGSVERVAGSARSCYARNLLLRRLLTGFPPTLSSPGRFQ